MHQIQSAKPRRELREYVRAFAQREIGVSDPEVVQPHPASLEQVLEFDFLSSPILSYPNGSREAASAISIVGPHTYRRLCIHLKGPVESFGIFFQPLGLWQLFQVPIRLMVNHGYQADSVLGKEIHWLWESMAEADSFQQRVCLAENYLLKRAANAAARLPAMNSALYIFQNRGLPRVSELASDAAWSVRQFERRFTAEIGITPKLFARITRFQMALDAKISFQERTWLDIAHDFGYHDQMHMIRDFQNLSGASPGDIILQLGDMRPSALAAAMQSSEK